MKVGLLSNALVARQGPLRGETCCARWFPCYTPALPSRTPACSPRRLGFYRRRMRAEGVTDGRSGAVTVVQRCNSDLKLNPHWHGLFVDGVYVKQADGQPVFHPLPRLCTEEVGDLMQVVRVRILSRDLVRPTIPRAVRHFAHNANLRAKPRRAVISCLRPHK